MLGGSRALPRLACDILEENFRTCAMSATDATDAIKYCATTVEQAIRAIDKSLKLLPEHVAESTGIKRHRDNYQARVDKLT